jgi:hypothetical protein
MVYGDLATFIVLVFHTFSIASGQALWVVSVSLSIHILLLALSVSQINGFFKDVQGQTIKIVADSHHFNQY